MNKLIVIFVLLATVLFIGACGSSQSYNVPPAPSGGGCGVSSSSSIATVCSAGDVNVFGQTE